MRSCGCLFEYHEEKLWLFASTVLWKKTPPNPDSACGGPGRECLAYMSACLLQQSKMRLNICSSNSPCVGRREEVMYIRVYLNSLVQQFTEKRRNSLVGLHVYYYSLCPVTDQRGTENQITQCCTCVLLLWQSAVTNGTRCSCLRSVVMMLFNISPVLHRRRKWEICFLFLVLHTLTCIDRSIWR